MRASRDVQFDCVNVKDKITAGFHYALRRTLVPWNFSHGLDELLRYCQNVSVDEVILKVDAEEFSHGLPSLCWIKKYQENLFFAKKRLNEEGIAYSLNPWVTVGHVDRGRRNDLVYHDFVWMVGHDGKRCTSQACPLGTGWRRWFKDVWTLYAQTEPRVLWVEDDIRTFNHLPVEVGCFCDLHMQRFSEQIGRKVDRESLVCALIQPGAVHPWRKLWLDMMGQIMVDVASMIAEIVNNISPQTCLGLMSSGVCNHAAEGRRWKDIVRELKGSAPKLYSRPPLWAYEECNLRKLFEASDSIMHTRAAINDISVEELTEVDNAPYTTFSKSNAFTFLQMAISAATGCEGVTLNLYDHCGSDFNVEPGIEKMLKESRLFLDELSRVTSKKDGLRGVGLMCCDRGAYTKQLTDGDSILDITPHDNIWQRVLNSFGIPTQYGSADVYAISGQTPYQLDRQEILALLGKGVILDGLAAHTLYKLGYGDYIGCTIDRMFKAREEFEIAAEELFDCAFGGRPQCYITANTAHMGDDKIQMADIIPGSKVTVAARMVDPDCKRLMPSIVLYENHLGGRVAIIAQDLEKSFGTAFLNHHRKGYLRNILIWLAKNRLDGYVCSGAYVLPIQTETPEGTVVSVFNLSLDEQENLEIVVAKKDRSFADAKWLEFNGSWHPYDSGSYRMDNNFLRIQHPSPISFQFPLVIKVRWGLIRS
jgi:hypothetical protein